MRFVVQVSLPVEKFNAAVRDGSIGAKMEKIMGAMKPEAAYFTATDGKRGGFFILDIKDPAEMPRIAEPWFLTFDAKVEFMPAMTPEDLGRANLAQYEKGW